MPDYLDDWPCAAGGGHHTFCLDDHTLAWSDRDLEPGPPGGRTVTGNQKLTAPRGSSGRPAGYRTGRGAWGSPYMRIWSRSR